MKLTLSVFAENLDYSKSGSGTNKATLPDPFVILTVLHVDDDLLPTILAQTETLYNTRSPHWTKPIRIKNFDLGKPLNIVATVYDNKASISNDKEPIGSVLFEIGEILGAKRNVVVKEIKKDGPGGVIGVKIEESSASVMYTGALRMQLHAVDLANKDGVGLGRNKSDPFYEIQRLRRNARNQDQAMWDTIFRSCVIDNNLNPKWPVTYIQMNVFPTSRDENLRILVSDKDDHGSSEIIGDVQVTMNQLLAKNESGLKLFDKNKNTGKIFVMEAEMEGAEEFEENEDTGLQQAVEVSVSKIDLSKKDTEPEIVVSIPEEDILYEEDDEITSKKPPTFVDYVTGGCELHVVVGIDSTASNGNPREQSSLHYFNDTSRNAYEEALYSVCSILSKYDTDQNYPMYGFGMKVDNNVNHCYSFGDVVSGVDGILKRYREIFRSGLVMSSPRDFSEVIVRAGDDAKKEFEKRQSYTILLLLTNGSPADVSRAFDAMTKVNDVPLSIVIVGIGEDDDGTKFKGIQHLDEVSRNTGDPEGGRRDKLRFVLFNEEIKNAAYKEKLTKAALDQIPDQLATYFLSKGIIPQIPETEEANEEIVVEEYNPSTDVAVPMSINTETGAVTVTANVKPPVNTSIDRPNLKKMIIMGKDLQGKIVRSKQYRALKKRFANQAMNEAKKFMNNVIRR